MREKPPILQNHTRSSPLPSPFWVLSLQRPGTDRQILNQGGALGLCAGARKEWGAEPAAGRGRVGVSIREGFLEEDKAEQK